MVMFEHDFIIITDNNKVILYSYRSVNRLSRQKLQPQKLYMSAQDWEDILKWAI